MGFLCGEGRIQVDAITGGLVTLVDGTIGCARDGWAAEGGAFSNPDITVGKGTRSDRSGATKREVYVTSVSVTPNG